MGCDIKQLNSLKQTRINSYLLKGDWEKCKALVKHGVDVNHRDKYGQTCCLALGLGMSVRKGGHVMWQLFKV